MPDLHSFVDTENVMHAQRMSQADEAVARFAATVPLSPQEGPEMLAEVADYLISRAPDSTAMRALDVYDGYSRPLRRDSEASELIARIWKFSQLPQMSRQERSNVQHSLMHAMAQCREVDGHRVCSTGVRQRLIAVVRGYTPLPEELPVPAQVVTSLTEKLHNETDGDPSTKQLRDFCAEALRHAQYVYRDTPRYIEEFRGSLRDSVQTLYDFEMGTI